MLEEINRAVREDDLYLTEWETGFIESVQKNMNAGISLTDKQDAVLEKIWKKLK